MKDKKIKGKGIYILSNFIINILLLLLINTLFISLFIDKYNDTFYNSFEFIIIILFIIYTNFICIRKIYYIGKCKVTFTKDSLILSNLKIKKKQKEIYFLYSMPVADRLKIYI